MKLMIGDFGLAAKLQPLFDEHGERIPNKLQPLTAKCGTWAYSAPEVCSGCDYTKGYDQRIDLWSLGLIAHILLSGYHPFDPDGDRSDKEMMSYIRQGNFEYDDDIWDQRSLLCRSFIDSLLQVDPDERASLKQLANHQWFRRGMDSSALTKISRRSQRGKGRLKRREAFRSVANFIRGSFKRLSGSFHFPKS
eukprot:g3327.t1